VPRTTSISILVALIIVAVAAPAPAGPPLVPASGFAKTLLAGPPKGPERTSHRSIAGDGERLAAQLARLSLDLRERPLSEAERDEAVARLAADSVDAIYRDHVDRWLGRRFFEKVLRAWLPLANDPAVPFLSLLRGRTAGGRDVLYLEHRHPGLEPGAPPCRADRVVSVVPWWSERPVAICEASYQKSVLFVDDHYCPQSADSVAGYSLPRECGCGPRLMHCLPPDELEPRLNAAVRDGIASEVMETAYDIAVRRRRPLGEVLTATRTWQNGVVRFLYARRELARLLHGRRLTPALERRIDRTLSRIPVRAGPTWVERRGLYAGSGLLFTPIDTFLPTYRSAVRTAYEALFCVYFESVNVDRDAILATVEEAHPNLRALDAITDSPMRHQRGCSGCHMPMDTTSGFLGDIELTWKGAYPRRARPAESPFYLRGADDYRGAARGIAGFMELAARQPEFPRCVVNRAFEKVLERRPQHGEAALIDELERGLSRTHTDLTWLVRELLLSRPYRELGN